MDNILIDKSNERLLFNKFINENDTVELDSVILNNAIKLLKEEYKDIIIMTFQNHYTLKEIGDKLNISNERVFAAKSTALRKLRQLYIKLYSTNSGNISRNTSLNYTSLSTRSITTIYRVIDNNGKHIETIGQLVDYIIFMKKENRHITNIGKKTIDSILNDEIIKRYIPENI